MTTSIHMNSGLHVRGLDVHRGSRILSDISFDVASAEIVAVVGPSGVWQDDALTYPCGHRNSQKWFHRR